MIPLPGLELFIRLLHVTVGLTVAAVLLAGVLVVSARRRWSAGHPARVEHHIAVGAVVWGLVWLVLMLPDQLALLALVPFTISAGGLAYVASGNRRRGHGNPRVLRPAATALGLAVLTLFLGALAGRLRHEADMRREAERVAEGRRDQDSFQALVCRDGRTLAVLGTTSTPPNDADDIWLRTFDLEGRPLASRTFVLPGDQAGLALAPGPDGAWLVAGQDDDHALLALATLDSTLRMHRWDSAGVASALAPTRDGGCLLGGRSEDRAWIARLDRSGEESWRRELELDNPYARVNALVVTGERFFAVGSDPIFGRSAFVAGGTLAGDIRWMRPFQAEPKAFCELTDACIGADGMLLALGSRSAPGALEDLWLARVSPDGALLDSSAFGDSITERAGGLALRGDTVIVVGHRFPGHRSELWLRAMDAHGGVRWERTYPDSGFGRANDVILLPGGDLVVAGSRTRGNKHDGWIARFDRTGAPLWQRTFPVSP